jgi:hypothetical protein
LLSNLCEIETVLKLFFKERMNLKIFGEEHLKICQVFKEDTQFLIEGLKGELNGNKNKED